MKKYTFPVLIGVLVFVVAFGVLMFVYTPSSQNSYSKNNTSFYDDFEEVSKEEAEKYTTHHDGKYTIEIKSGDTLLSILTKMGVDHKHAIDVFVSIAKVFNPRDLLYIGQKIEIETATIDGSYMVKSLTSTLSTGQHLNVTINDDKTYSAHVEKVERIEEIIFTNGQKLEDILRKYGVTDEKLLNSIIVRGPRKNLNEKVAAGDVLKIYLLNEKFDKIIIKLKSDEEYISSRMEGGRFIHFSSYWKEDRNPKFSMRRVAIGTNLLGDNQYFYHYTAKDMSRRALDAAVNSLKRNYIEKGASFDLYDDFYAAKMAHIEWNALHYYDKVRDNKEFQEELQYCYNYILEHSLVGTDNYGTVVFSNYELNDKYRENLRSGIYKKCNPEEFIDKYEALAYFLSFEDREKKKTTDLIKNNEAKKCQQLIRSKYRYVNSLIFEKKIDVDIKDNIYSISGVLNVQSTNRDKAKQAYNCMYDNEKKEFVDWSVGKLELVGD